MLRSMEVLKNRKDIGDVEKGMDAVVDLVRGEGQAAGKRSWPLWVVLHEEAIANVRDRLTKMSNTIDEWESLGVGLSINQSPNTNETEGIVNE